MNVILLLLINRIYCPGDIGGGFCPDDIGGGFCPDDIGGFFYVRVILAGGVLSGELCPRMLLSAQDSRATHSMLNVHGG